MREPLTLTYTDRVWGKHWHRAACIAGWLIGMWAIIGNSFPNDRYNSAVGLGICALSVLMFVITIERTTTITLTEEDTTDDQ